MSSLTPEQLNQNTRGRVPPIFLSYEPEGKYPDLFSYSQDFQVKHTADEPLSEKALVHGFGTIAIVRQLDKEGKRSLPPHECIAFDARQPGEYVWDIDYAHGGVVQVARLWVRPSEIVGKFARTDNQGRLIDAFDLTPWEAFAAGRHLSQRLASDEVKQAISEAYDKRKSVMAARTKLVNERTAETVEFARLMNMPINQVPINVYYEKQIAKQEQQLKITGFVPMMIFNPKWLETKILD